MILPHPRDGFTTVSTLPSNNFIFNNMITFPIDERF